MSVVQTDRGTYGHVITKISWMSRLPQFLTIVLRCTRFARARAPLLLEVILAHLGPENSFVKKGRKSLSLTETLAVSKKKNKSTIELALCAIFTKKTRSNPNLPLRQNRNSHLINLSRNLKVALIILLLLNISLAVKSVFSCIPGETFFSATTSEVLRIRGMGKHGPFGDARHFIRILYFFKFSSGSKFIRICTLRLPKMKI